MANLMPDWGCCSISTHMACDLELPARLIPLWQRKKTVQSASTCLMAQGVSLRGHATMPVVMTNQKRDKYNMVDCQVQHRQE